MTQYTINSIGKKTLFASSFRATHFPNSVSSDIQVRISGSVGVTLINAMHSASVSVEFLMALPPNALLVLYEPLMLLITSNDGEVVVQNDQLGVYGAGSSRAEAIEDFCDALEDQYLFLKSRETELGKGLKQTLAALTAIVHERKR